MLGTRRAYFEMKINGFLEKLRVVVARRDKKHEDIAQVPVELPASDDELMFPHMRQFHEPMSLEHHQYGHADQEREKVPFTTLRGVRRSTEFYASSMVDGAQRLSSEVASLITFLVTQIQSNHSLVLHTESWVRNCLHMFSTSLTNLKIEVDDTSRPDKVEEMCEFANEIHDCIVSLLVLGICVSFIFVFSFPRRARNHQYIRWRRACIGKYS